MLIKDKIQLAKWLSCGASLAEVEATSRFGLVENERFTEHARRAFVFLWIWSAPRFAGCAGAKHDRFYNRMGKDAYNRRILRVQRIIEQIKERA